MGNNIGLHGHLKVWDDKGELIVDQGNFVVNAGIDIIVDALVAEGNINAFKYIGFGTGTGASAATSTALGTEVSGGTYARLTATQGEGATGRVYRLSGTWTNNSAGSVVVTEYGIFNAATVGAMLSRVSTGDAAPPASKTVGVGETLAVQWDITFQNVAAA